MTKTVLRIVTTVALIASWTIMLTQPVLAEDICVSRDTLVLSPDSAVVIETACAPVCASVVRILDKNGMEIGRIHSPFDNAVFPEAYISNGLIIWKDNTPEILDDEEKKHYGNK